MVFDGARVGFFTAACLAAAELGHLLSVPTQGWAVAAIWPPSGLLLGTLVLVDRRRWAAWLLAASGAIVVSGVVLHHQRLLVSLGFCAAYALEACIGASLLQRVVDKPFTMARVQDVWALAASALAATMAGAALEAGTLAAVAGVSSFLLVWQTCWLADVLGVFLVAPLLLALQAERAAFASMARSWRLVEIVVVLAGTIVIAQGVYGDLFPPEMRVPAYILPFLLWAAFRFEPGGAAVVMLVTGVIGMWNAAHGQGPYTILTTSTSQAVSRSQGTLAVTSLSILLLAGIVAERKRSAQERNILVADLQKALGEIKTLEGLLPVCAWCHKIRDDAGFWQNIEAYLRVHTQATFSHGICPDCSRQMATRSGRPPSERSPS
jgi:integral membrane sensor domain MASE1